MEAHRSLPTEKEKDGSVPTDRRRKGLLGHCRPRLKKTARSLPTEAEEGCSVSWDRASKDHFGPLGPRLREASRSFQTETASVTVSSVTLQLDHKPSSIPLNWFKAIKTCLWVLPIDANTFPTQSQQSCIHFIIIVHHLQPHLTTPASTNPNTIMHGSL